MWHFDEFVYCYYLVIPKRTKKNFHSDWANFNRDVIALSLAHQMFYKQMFCNWIRVTFSIWLIEQISGCRELEKFFKQKRVNNTLKYESIGFAFPDLTRITTSNFINLRSERNELIAFCTPKMKFGQRTNTQFNGLIDNHIPIFNSWNHYIALQEEQGTKRMEKNVQAAIIIKAI